MQAKHVMAGAMLMAGLLSGCGGPGPDIDVEDASNLESREDALPSCNGQSYERVFYSEPEKINEVGRWTCVCSSSSAYMDGQTTIYSTYFNRRDCFPP